MWGALQWLKATVEQDNSGNPTYGVYSTKTTPVEGTDFSWARLDQNNAFTPRPKPEPYVINSADGGNRPVQYGSARTSVGGSLNKLFYPTTAAFWLKLALQLTNNDLPSVSLEYFDTQRTYRLLGCKVDKLVLRCAAMDQVARLAIDFVCQKPATSPPALAAPVATNFPSVLPYTHQDSFGQVLLNNVTRVNYSSLEVTIDNKLAPTFDEQQYITALYYAGRNVDWVLKSQYAALADRAAYEATTAQITSQVKWLKGANSVTLDLKSSNYFTGVTDELPLDNAAYQTLAVKSLYDRTATTDLAYTVV